MYSNKRLNDRHLLKIQSCDDTHTPHESCEFQTGMLSDWWKLGQNLDDAQMSSLGNTLPVDTLLKLITTIYWVRRGRQVSLFVPRRYTLAGGGLDSKEGAVVVPVTSITTLYRKQCSNFENSPKV